jgi:hypothetical protein
VEQTELMFPLKHLHSRKYSFQNINQVSQEYNMSDAEASSRECLFGEIHVFLQLD